MEKLIGGLYQLFPIAGYKVRHIQSKDDPTSPVMVYIDIRRVFVNPVPDRCPPCIADSIGHSKFSGRPVNINFIYSTNEHMVPNLLYFKFGKKCAYLKYQSVTITIDAPFLS